MIESMCICMYAMNGEFSFGMEMGNEGEKRGRLIIYPFFELLVFIFLG